MPVPLVGGRALLLPRPRVSLSRKLPPVCHSRVGWRRHKQRGKRCAGCQRARHCHPFAARGLSVSPRGGDCLLGKPMVPQAEAPISQLCKLRPRKESECLRQGGHCGLPGLLTLYCPVWGKNQSCPAGQLLHPATAWPALATRGHRAQQECLGSGVSGVADVLGVGGQPSWPSLSTAVSPVGPRGALRRPG